MNSHQRAFLAAFRETCNVRLACEVAKVGRSSHYRWLDKDPEYREAFGLAKEDAADILEAEAYRRAVEGVEKPVGWYKGKPGGYVREYSDILLIFLLKALRPEKYRERVEVRGLLANLDLNKLPDDLIARLAAGDPPVRPITEGVSDQREGWAASWKRGGRSPRFSAAILVGKASHGRNPMA